jgi:hypothetical protein
LEQTRDHLIGLARFRKKKNERDRGQVDGIKSVKRRKNNAFMVKLFPRQKYRRGAEKTKNLEYKEKLDRSLPLPGVARLLGRRFQKKKTDRRKKDQNGCSDVGE